MITRLTVLFSVAILVAASVGSYQWAMAGSGGNDSTEAKADPAASGAVTIEEYDAAINAKLDCMEANGLVVDERFPRDGKRLTRARVHAPDSDGEADFESVRSAQATAAECRVIHQDPVEERWDALFVMPTEAEVAALIDRLLACVAKGGVPANARIPSPALATYPYGPAKGIDIPNDERMELYSQCALAEEATTGLSAPIPLFLLAGEP